MPWQVQNPGVISERFDILFRLAVLKLAYLRLREPKPPSKEFLIERLAKKLKMTGVISVDLEDLANVLTFEGCPEVVRLEELVPELGRRRAELIPLFPVTPAAQACGVVRREHCPAARTATPTADRATPLRTGSAHLIPRQGWSRYASDQRTWVARRPPTSDVTRQKVGHHLPIFRSGMQHAELDIDAAAGRRDG
jgi:hypothetical protein